MAKKDKSMRMLKSNFNSKHKQRGEKYMETGGSKGAIWQAFRIARNKEK